MTRPLAGLPDFSARELQAVVLVARYFSFIAAASELRLSQPGLSRIIRKVEDGLGTELFRRTTRQVTLTAAGAQFVPIAERLLQDLTAGVEVVRGLRDEARGQVAIGCPMSVAQSSLIGILLEYRKRHPQVTLVVHEGLQSLIREEILNGILDFGIGFIRQPIDDLLVEPLHDGSFHVAFHRDHPFAQRESIPLLDLRDEVLISMPPSANLRQIFDGAAASGGFRLNHAITVNTYATLYALVSARAGIAILPDPGVPPPDDAVLLSRPIDAPRVASRLSVMSLKSRIMSPAAQRLKELVVEYFRDKRG
ncbi:LysR family transcriptional regulator [Roseomonas populi]|uniref:LysR family transcriptional regulator n=1 Tax=Roseomonas populi TaxID=3121582 RepID=A0ABT1X6M6_9PROT|nr:LysR family transcriptional regulator [Roseomonas pecuniae]MCR0983760.1 LysR family transcriptional regulator [Roseomonas pecuniae]